MENCSLNGGRNCCDNPALGLGLLRIGVALLFLLPGIMKLMNPAMIEGMVQNVVGIPGMAGTILAWLVIIAEVGGGIVVLLGKFVPKCLYKISLLSFVLILLVATFTVHMPKEESFMPVLKHFMMLTGVLCLMFTRPMCPKGICGDKE